MSTGRSHRDFLRRRSFPWGASASGWPNLAVRRATLVRHVVAAAFAGLLALAVDVPDAEAATCCGASDRTWRAGEIVGPIGDVLIVRWAPDDAADSVAIPSAPLRDAARSLRRPEHALIAYTEEQGVKTLAAVGVRVNRWQRIVAIVGAAGIIVLFAALCLLGRLRWLALGQDNRHSKSKWQMVLWFGVLVVSYLATAALRWWAGGAAFAGGIDVPEKLLILSGLSALTFVGAKAITQGKVDRAEARLREQPALPAARSAKEPATRPSFPGDLLNDDHGHVDFGDFQMILVTLLAVVAYGVRVFVCLGQIELACQTMLPDVDTTILGAFGIGQGAYLAKKAASRLGEG